MTRSTNPSKHYENRPLPPGKLPAPLLAELLSALPSTDPQLVLGPAVGEDAAIIDFAAGSENLLVAKIDPITFASDEIGYYAVNVCANDLAVTGATPRFYMPAILLPAGGADTDRARLIFDQIGAACAKLGIVVAGGHSEVTHTVSRPVVAGAMLGEVPRDRYVSTRGARPGDAILLAGAIPVEGTSIIARERRAVLLQQGWPAEELDRAAQFLFDPGISVLAPAHAATRTGLVTAMHDPTEGGVASGLVEMALAADAGLDVDLARCPSPISSRRLCAAFDLDPLGVIASGACSPRRRAGAVCRVRGDAAGRRLSAISRRTPAICAAATANRRVPALRRRRDHETLT